MTSVVSFFHSNAGGAAVAGALAPTWAWRASDLSLAPYIGSGTPAITRAGNTATRINSSGLIETVNANLARYDYSLAGVLQGLLVEPAATNIALHNNDQTNAAWVKGATMTAAKDQTGPDGVANSASKLTGGAVSTTNTSLQTVVLASSARKMSAYVKRVTGTGTIEMTTNNGTNWDAITITSSWARYDIAVRTLANPVFGFRITTDTDAIAVAFVQNETDILTSPTTEVGAAAVTRNADAITLATASLTGFSATAGSIVTRAKPQGFNAVLLGGGSQTVTALTDGTGNESILVGGRVNTSNEAYEAVIVDGGALQCNVQGAAWANSTTGTVGGAWSLNDIAGYFNGTAGTPDTSATIPTVTTLYIGSYNATGQWNAHINEIKYYNTRLANATLQALTA